MKLEIFNNREEWNKWQIQQKQAEFLQSSEWGQFQENTGKKVLRWRIYDDSNEVVGQMQGIENQLSVLGKYLYVPRLKTTDYRLQNAIDFLKEQNYLFVRIEPLEKISNIKYSILDIESRQPKQTLILDLQQTEDQILSSMHAKTRYNIHLAEKNNVEIREEKNIDIFWNLNLETTARDKFKSHGKEYYEKMLQFNLTYQLTAYYKNKPIASNIFIKFGDTLTYLHGASSGDFRNLMAPYLLQWEGMKLGKRLECKFYDFWGIAPIVSESDNKPHSCFHNLCWQVDHKWTGVTRFKAGFGGTVKEYPQACDIILKPFIYKLYKLAKKVL